jgi:hypothetical protein
MNNELTRKKITINRTVQIMGISPMTNTTLIIEIALYKLRWGKTQ